MENVPDAVNSHKFKFSTQGKNKHFFLFITYAKEVV